MTYTNSSLKTKEKGFTPILILVLVVALVAVIYFVVMGAKNTVSQSPTNMYGSPTPTESAPSLEQQLNQTEDTDPSGDFKSVDTDINSY